METKSSYVSVEWASQLLFDAFGAGDKNTAYIQASPKMLRVVIPIPRGNWGFQTTEDELSITPTCEIELRLWFDGINEEFTPIGFAQSINTFVYGPTRRRYYETRQA